jgi:beta-lactamase class A
MIIRKRALIIGLSLALLGAPPARHCFSGSGPVVGETLPDPRWVNFNAQLSKMVAREPGVSGLFIKDLRRGLEYTYNIDRTFPSASLIKLPVLVATFQAIKEGKISMETIVSMERKDRRGGSGRLRFYPAGSSFKVSELLDHMIGESDNTATHLMVTLLGFHYLNQVFENVGLKETRIHPEGLLLTEGHVRNENYTTPREMAFLLEKIYRRELVSQQASDQMVGILKKAGCRDRLARYLPPDWQLAHKTGLLRRACHDCGVVYSPEGDFLVCVLTARNRNYRRAKRFIASIGRRTFNFYSSSRGQIS